MCQKVHVMPMTCECKLIVFRLFRALSLAVPLVPVNPLSIGYLNVVAAMCFLNNNHLRTASRTLLQLFVTKFMLVQCQIRVSIAL